MFGIFYYLKSNIIETTLLRPYFHTCSREKNNTSTVLHFIVWLNTHRISDKKLYSEVAIGNAFKNKRIRLIARLIKDLYG